MPSTNSSTTIVLILLTITAIASPAFALPQLLGAVGALLGLVPLLSTPPPRELWTKTPAPECANVNGGALLCCQSTFQGDIPIIVQLAPLIGYKLNPNSNNCIYGKKNFNACNPGTRMCCQVDVLATTPLSDLVSLALYCQNAPDHD
ncbi:hypothetical protein DL95DRAFT_440341 [Leptodontidium sp. 2 PMI_412]|nr:hypothetical protein BKA61DRAFT_237769 [Leptodontidium sp. MPI-SDFR-AT-0119]KAH9224324.1 hypothetical protein DL95DRAFT_440341 [Leptodontidium sp. 2 PMI_412]